MIFFYKIFNNLAPSYLRDYLPARLITPRNLRSQNPIYPLNIRTERFRDSFYPYCIFQWNCLDGRIRDRPSVSTFKKAIFEFIRPKPSPVFGAFDNQGVVLLTRLRLGFSHLNEHKFRHGFRDTLNPFCACSTNSIENSQHFILHCSIYSHARHLLFNKLHTLGINFFPLSPHKLFDLLLFGDSDLTPNINNAIINYTIEFIHETDRFSGPLF